MAFLARGGGMAEQSDPIVIEDYSQSPVKILQGGKYR